MGLFSVAALALLACEPSRQAADAPETEDVPTLFRAVRIFDGSGVVPCGDVLVRNGLIAEIGEGLSTPPGAIVVDGTGKTLLPGLIDAHFHVYFEEQLMEAAASGITTVLDMGSDWRVGRGIKKRMGGPAGRRMADVRLAGNPVTVPGGYGTRKGVPVETLLAAEGATAFIDARIAEGSDHIKFCLDDGRAFGEKIPTLDRERFAAAVDAAHSRGKLTVVHVSTQREARLAIECGVDGLAHIFFDGSPEEDFARLAASRGIFVVPTLNVGSGKPRQKFAVEAVRRLKEAGVSLLAGSDGPTNVSLLDELDQLVRAGLTPSEALASATSVPAASFRMPDRGRIARGLRADLLLVEGDPTADVRAVRRIAGIWKQGGAIDRAVFTAEADARRRAGKVSDFDDGRTAATFGGWGLRTDDASTGRIDIVSPGAGGRGSAMSITGEIGKGAGFSTRHAGAVFTPGLCPDGTADFSSKTELVFQAKGNPKRYSVAFFSKGRSRPADVAFEAGEGWREYRFPLSAFKGVDCRALTGVFIGAVDDPGAFTLTIDDVEFR